MSGNKGFERLSREELEHELSVLEQKLRNTPGDRRVKNVFQNLRIHQVELEMQNRELRELQDSLEETRDRYADLYDFAPIGYMTLDHRGAVREINLTAARMLNRPRAELLDRPFVPRVAPGQSKAFFQHLTRALSDPVKATIELALRAPHDDGPWVKLESVRVLSQGETVCRTAMIDTTEQRRVEADLRRRERQLRRVTDVVPVLISYVDRNMRYRSVNAVYHDWFGMQADQLIGRRVEETIGASAALRPFARRVLRGEEVTFDSTVTHRLHGARRVSVHLIPDQDDAGNVQGYFAVITDITDRAPQSV